MNREEYNDGKCPEGYEYVKGYKKRYGKEYVKGFCRKKHYKESVIKKEKSLSIPKITNELLDGKTVYIKTREGIYEGKVGGPDNTIRFHAVRSLKPDDKYYYIPNNEDFISLASEIVDNWWGKTDKNEKR